MRAGEAYHPNFERARMRFASCSWARCCAVLAWLARRRRRTVSTAAAATISSFEIRNGDPAVCAARCERDARCHAWSFSYPRTANAIAACWLKNSVPPRRRGQMLRVRRARRRRGRAAQGADRISPSTASAATIAISTFRPICRRRCLQGGVRGGEHDAAPGPMCGRATCRRQRAAISRTRSRGRGTSRAAFRAWCDSCAQ